MDSQLSIATIRSLGIDMINKAKSGHPGMVLGSAPALYTLFTRELKVNPKNPNWHNRDRFVLASGHASALLYSLLHLSGYNLSLDDLKQFRQFGSKTPGHPERQLTPGVDAASGPLGQGIPEAVGMALAEKFLATKYNKEGYPIIDHYTYVLCGDGDMMEGVTYEASSLAGHWALGKLVVIYDANDVTLDGPLSDAFSENVKKRYEAMNWQVLEVADGNDTDAILRAIRRGKREQFRPTLIIMKTIIGYGSAKQGTNAVHGAPLGEEDGKRAKHSYGFDYDETFYVPDEVYKDFEKHVAKRGLRENIKWNNLVSKYHDEYKDLIHELDDAVNGKYTLDYDEVLKDYPYGSKEATRNVSQRIIQEVAKQNPTYMSGVADLASSTKTLIKNENHFSPEHYDGRNLSFGIREFAMTSIMNGMMLHKGVKVSGGGFLVFSDYAKAAIRMASLMELPIIMPFSHDTIAVGEDGPTHQPIEQLASLRSMVDVTVIRAADAYELCAGWKIAVESLNTPTALILTRQAVPNITKATYDDVLHGAYVVSKEEGELDGIIIAAGSEVALALEAKEAMKKEGNMGIRVVSMPSMELFNAQTNEYKEEILPLSCRKRLVVEMSSDFGWYRYAGLDGKVLSVNTYGMSAPASRVIKEYGFDVDHVINLYKSL